MSLSDKREWGILCPHCNQLISCDFTPTEDVKEFLDEENKLFDLLMVGEINSLEFFRRRTELLGSKLVERGLKNGKRS